MSHRRSTQPWPLRLQVQRGSTVANHPEIKSQVICVSALETSAMRSLRFVAAVKLGEAGQVQRAPAGEVVAAGGSAGLGGVAAFGPPPGPRHAGSVSV